MALQDFMGVAPGGLDGCVVALDTDDQDAGLDVAAGFEPGFDTILYPTFDAALGSSHVESELALTAILESDHARGKTSVQAFLDSAYPVLKGLEEISAVILDGRRSVDPHRGFRDHAEDSLGADHDAIEIRSGRRCWNRLGDDRTRGGNDLDRDDHVLDLAVGIGLHARGARREPPAQGGVFERVREMTERVPLLRQVGLELGAERAGLDRRGPGFPVNGNQAAHVAQTEGDDWTGFVGLGIDAAYNVGPTAERDQAEVELLRQGDQGLDLLMGIRQYNCVRSAPHYSTADAKEIREALPVTVLQPLERIQRDLLGVEDGTQCGEHFIAGACWRDLHRGEINRVGGWRRARDSEFLYDPRPQRWLVSHRESQVRIAPTPPLHHIRGAPGRGK